MIFATRLGVGILYVFPWPLRVGGFEQPEREAGPRSVELSSTSPALLHGFRLRRNNNSAANRNNLLI
jgi:hypothetical protein